MAIFPAMGIKLLKHQILIGWHLREFALLIIIRRHQFVHHPGLVCLQEEHQIEQVFTIGYLRAHNFILRKKNLQFQRCLKGRAMLPACPVNGIVTGSLIKKVSLNQVISVLIIGLQHKIMLRQAIGIQKILLGMVKELENWRVLAAGLLPKKPIDGLRIMLKKTPTNPSLLSLLSMNLMNLSVPRNQ